MNFVTGTNVVAGKKVIAVGMNSITVVDVWVASKVLLNHIHRQYSTNFHLLRKTLRCVKC